MKSYTESQKRRANDRGNPKLSAGKQGEQMISFRTNAEDSALLTLDKVEVGASFPEGRVQDERPIL